MHFPEKNYGNCFSEQNDNIGGAKLIARSLVLVDAKGPLGMS